MKDIKEMYKSWIRIIFSISIIITLIFIAIFFIIGLKINRLDSCMIDDFGSNPNAITQNCTNPLNNVSNYVLQEYALNSSNYIKYKFCFNVDCLKASEIQVINENENVLATEFVYSGNKSYCVDFFNLTEHQYIGLKCPSCINESNKCTLKRTVSTEDVKIIAKTNGLLKVVEASQLNFQLYAYKNCKSLTKFLLWAYLILIGSLFFILFILLGFSKLEKLMFEDFNLIK